VAPVVKKVKFKKLSDHRFGTSANCSCAVSVIAAPVAHILGKGHRIWVDEIKIGFTEETIRLKPQANVSDIRKGPP
jgi:hypothetical protein